MPRRSSIQIELTAEERSELERRVRLTTAPHQVVIRARVVLMLAEGHSITDTSHHVGLGRRIVHKWGERFVNKRLDGLRDNPRSGRPPRFSPGGGDASDQDGVRAAGCSGAVDIAVEK